MEIAKAVVRMCEDSRAKFWDIAAYLEPTSAVVEIVVWASSARVVFCDGSAMVQREGEHEEVIGVGYRLSECACLRGRGHDNECEETL